MPEPTIASLLTALQREPGRPRLTWYGDDFDRVELSGAVLENWVHKTANLLVEEFDAGPGTRVRLDLPGHWRTVVWALSVWRVGGCVVLGTSTEPVDVLVTSDAEAAESGAQLVVVTLPALARRAPAPLPAGAIDAAAAVMTYGDVLAWAPEIDLDAAGLDAQGAVTAHRDLAGWAGAPTAERALVVLGDDEPAGCLRATLGGLLGAGSVVLAVPGALADPAARARLVAAERVTTER